MLQTFGRCTVVSCSRDRERIIERNEKRFRDFPRARERSENKETIYTYIHVCMFYIYVYIYMYISVG